MRPHRSTVIAVIALVFSMTGGAIAAVNYARNAGAVDGYSAVKAESSNTKAAGKLVAMDAFGRLPAKFLDAVRTERGGLLVPVTDNSYTEPQAVLELGVGRLLMACGDAQATAGLENPTTRLAITNYTPGTLNIARREGSGQGAVNSFGPNTSDVFEVGGQGVFEAQVQNEELTIFIHGGVRQSGQGTAESQCGVFATAFFTD
jgi:hypothetical protein